MLLLAHKSPRWWQETTQLSTWSATWMIALVVQRSQAPFRQENSKLKIIKTQTCNNTTFFSLKPQCLPIFYPQILEKPGILDKYNSFKIKILSKSEFIWIFCNIFQKNKNNQQLISRVMGQTKQFLEIWTMNSAGMWMFCCPGAIYTSYKCYKMDLITLMEHWCRMLYHFLKVISKYKK